MTTTRHAAAPRRTLTGTAGGIAGGLVVAAALMLGAAACAETVQTVPAREAPPVTGPAEPGTPAADDTAAQDGLSTAVTPLGIVVTSDGRTVYRYDKDSADPSRSTCVGDCAKKWTPLLGDGVPALDGIPANLVGTVGRADGTQQLTLNGWPLYRFTDDARLGDTRGDGVAGAWRAIGVDGAPAG